MDQAESTGATIPERLTEAAAIAGETSGLLGRALSALRGAQPETAGDDPDPACVNDQLYQLHRQLMEVFAMVGELHALCVRSEAAIGAPTDRDVFGLAREAAAQRVAATPRTSTDGSARGLVTGAPASDPFSEAAMRRQRARGAVSDHSVGPE